MFSFEFFDTDDSVVLEVKRLYFSWLEKLAHNEKVTGSIPVGRTSWLDGGTGRHASLKMMWTNVRAGSIPAPTTKQLNPLTRGFLILKYL